MTCARGSGKLPVPGSGRTLISTLDRSGAGTSWELMRHKSYELIKPYGQYCDSDHAADDRYVAYHALSRGIGTDITRCEIDRSHFCRAWVDRSVTIGITRPRDCAPFGSDGAWPSDRGATAQADYGHCRTEKCHGPTDLVEDASNLDRSTAGEIRHVT